MPTRAPYLGKLKPRRVNLADAEHKVLGVRGKPMFSNLSYFKCVHLCHAPPRHCPDPQDAAPPIRFSPPQVWCSPCHMFRFGVAHIILLGLLKDFWAQWLPSGKGKPRPAGPASKFVLPPHVRKAISDRRKYVMLTELFKKPYSDIVKCVITMEALGRLGANCACHSTCAAGQP